jgi:CDGSH-type Zn-finger protein/truncated hemoglobin YjbI
MTTGSSISTLLQDLRGLRSSLPPAVLARIDASVIRPLVALYGDTPGATQTATGSPEQWRALLWDFAKRVTLAYRDDGSVQMFEAAAALQDLACSDNAADESVEARLDWLRSATAEMPGAIVLSPNGPLLVRNVERFVNYLGEAIPVRPLMALCRCGASAMKPLCDGHHAEIGFTDAKDPKRVRDRLDTYVGQQVTVLDNRGTCQHSGFCTDRVPTVFHVRGDTFVTPSGGRMDEIIRTVRRCPSGALSYAIDGVEAREDVDYHEKRPPEIEVSKDGPYRVTGGIPVEDASGNQVPRNAGASLEHCALCRCGHSQNKPFCSGMHWYIDFHDPVPDVEKVPSIYEWAGGLPALLRMTRIFYEKYVPADDLLAPLFSDMSADHPERVAKWLAEVFGGPHRYSEEYGGYPRMLSQHIGKHITEDMRARWVSLLLQSAKEAGLPNDPEFASAFQSYIAWGSRLAVENSQTDSKPPQHMPMPHWDWSTAAGPPGSRISALAPSPQAEPEEGPPAPGPNETVSFEKHIKGLFRSMDRKSMQFAFDLWSYDDVSKHADAILERLRDGTMPCDKAWPQGRISIFARWISSGKAE